MFPSFACPSFLFSTYRLALLCFYSGLVILIFLFSDLRKVAAEPRASTVGLELASRTIELLFDSDKVYRLEADQAKLQYLEHYALGAKGWVALGYLAATLFDHPIANGLDLTGHTLDLGVSQTWSTTDWSRFSVEGNYSFQVLDGVEEQSGLRLRWHNPSVQAKAVVRLSSHVDFEAAIIGQKIDGVFSGKVVEASNFRAAREAGASAGITWEIDPGGYVRFTVVRLVESSARLQFVRDFNF